MRLLLLLCALFFAATVAGQRVASQRVAIRRRPPKKKPTTRPKSITSPAEDFHGQLGPGGQIEASGVSREGCSAPEVVVNGSAVAGGATDFSTVQEIHFFGLIGRRGQRRECKIKCLNGVWVGPMCTEAGGQPIKRIPRRCTLRLSSPSDVSAWTEDGRAVDRAADFPHGAALRLRCAQPGLYKFVGNDTLLCDDGSWSDDLPYCVATTLHRNFSLQAPPTILYHVVSGDAGVAENGSVVVFPGTILHVDCLFQRHLGTPQWTWSSTQRQYPSAWAIAAEEKNWKYRLSIYYAKDSDSGTFTCVTPGDVANEIDIVVKDVNCPSIGSVDHNRVMAVEGNRMHSRAHFACIEGYRLLGPEEITCRVSGQWSDEAPHCELLECPELESSHLILNTQNRTFGTRVTFSCPTGFKLSGQSFLTCTKTANWSAETPTCNPISCKAADAPVNGRVLDTGRFLSGDFVQFTCNAGHVLVGESVSICTDHGVWSHPTPVCQAACEYPGAPANGQIYPHKFHYAIGEVALVGCQPGFRVLGFQQLRCTASSNWSSPLPKCRPALQS